VAANLVGGIAQNLLGGGAGGAGGPFGPLLNSLTSAFSGLFNQAAGPLSPFISAVPQLFSGAGFSPQMLNDPMSHVRPSVDYIRYAGDIVRDHRTGATQSSGLPADDAQLLNSLSNDVKSAKEALIADPKNPVAAANFQEAMQALQNISRLLSEESSMFASIQSGMIQKSRVS
jgi:hypothetical protein